MQKVKLAYSELTKRVYITSGNNKVDVTSDFISVLLMKFPPGFKCNLSVNGIEKYEITLKEIEPCKN